MVPGAVHSFLAFQTPSRDPKIRHGMMIAFLGGEKIEMEGGEVFQGRFEDLRDSKIDGFDELVTLIAEVNAMGLLSLTGKIAEGARLRVPAIGTSQPFQAPLKIAEGTEEKPGPCFVSQQAERRETTTDRTVALQP